MGKTTSRVLAGVVLAASLTGVGAGVAAAQNHPGASASENPIVIGPEIGAETGKPVNPDDDWRRGGRGAPIGDAGQLKVLEF